MRKNCFLIVAGLCLLSGCKNQDLYDEDRQSPNDMTHQATQDEINANVQKVFGVTFSPDQDWCTTNSGKVTISISNSELSDVEKVQILTVSPFGNKDANGAKSLNETAMSFGQSVTLY